MSDGLSYAGDLDPKEAFALLGRDAGAVLVDVRTHAEWSFVGAADLSALKKDPLFVEWQSYPAMAVNEDFAATLEGELSDLIVDANVTSPKERALLFLCRSGVRSVAAAQAMTAKGYPRCFNIKEGFEGGVDRQGHRGAGGWKSNGLAWRQG